MSALSTNATVVVIGAGAMGSGIAQVAAQAGHPVLLYDARDGAAKKGREGVLANLGRLVEKGRLEPDDAAATAARLTVAASLMELKGARLVVEAIVEDLAIKRKLFGEIEDLVAEETILATNTSSLSVTAIAAGLRHPHRVCGLHFFNPAPVMALVEIVSGLASDAEVLDVLVATARSWGKVPVRATSTPGFIVNRVARPFYAEGLRLLEEAASDVPTLDAIMREAGGFRMGPFELMDLIGHDVNFAVTRSVFEANFCDPRFRPSLVQQELVAAGWLGRKTGRGFYDHAAGAAPPRVRTCSPAPAPRSVVIEGVLGPAEPLAAALANAGIPVECRPGEGLIRMEGATLALSDGRTATARVAGGAAADLVLFDVALDYVTAKRVAIAKADQAPDAAIATAAGLFQSLGKTVSLIGDLPGLVVLRTVAMLANEAAEAAHLGVATPSDIDRAMKLGLNYPKGPLAWAQDIGVGRVLETLEALQAAYGDDRYRASLFLRRRAASGMALM
ncbi:MAG TPA: 3-hydroxyacyl-CoA dehydrogenase PaaH [Aliidongia sp.]|uniref:3-hydroxyacyl-CoA dehydrogenase PaaH n=1 Tax=Aliidongia sp. TaxID=1914230 RepID=UPI002DDD6B94|nr:3-hydroxyacyl-CoA dehydrogenase PaaH [Aliidongia sp.]HEV2673047.1 3-hydroxyacyl-CoA dehydrogenase PaaH [Aliidongia sp.]